MRREGRKRKDGRKGEKDRGKKREKKKRRGTGEIDASENNMIAYLSLGHNDSAKYFLREGFIRIPEVYIINEEFFNKLSNSDQKILLDSANEASLLQRQLYEEKKSEAREELLESGVIFTELSIEEKSRFQEAMLSVYDECVQDRSELVDRILAID